MLRDWIAAQKVVEPHLNVNTVRLGGVEPLEMYVGVGWPVCCVSVVRASRTYSSQRKVPACACGICGGNGSCVGDALIDDTHPCIPFDSGRKWD
eukprot:gene11831-biopygen4749